MSKNDERRAIEQLVCTNLRTVKDLPGLARRGPHTKHHGCVSAIFRVRANIPNDLRHGLFAKPGDFQALIRLSSAVGDNDRKGDVHGFAIKVLGVPGLKMLKGREQESAQDFVLIDTETFLTGDPVPYELFNRLEKTLPRLVRWVSFVRMLLFHFPVMVRLVRTKLKSKGLSSLLGTSYFSTTPYALGPNRVKYVVQPRETAERRGVDSPEGLGDALETALAQGERVFDFGVDIQNDRGRQPIEDPSVNWREAGAEREWIAEIVIPMQSVDRTAPRAENLTFSPWHTLPEHEPLGYINRARRTVYGRMQCFRHTRNRIDPLESSEAPPSYDYMPPPVFGKLYWEAPKPRGLKERLTKEIGPRLRKILVERPWIGRFIERVPWLRLRLNRFIINRYASMTAPRPLPLSLWTPGARAVTANRPPGRGAYVSWPSLVDRSFTGRHLPPMEEAQAAALPDRDQIRALFERRKNEKGEDIPAFSRHSSSLLCFFAQWLSDSFLRTDPIDRRRNTSNHELDLCQIYGLGQETTRILRAGKEGRLASRTTKKGEFPPFLVDRKTEEVKKKFKNISFDAALAASFDPNDPQRGRAADLRKQLAKNRNLGPWATDDDRWAYFYAGGLERANSTVLYSAFNTLFLREHNRLAGELRKKYNVGDDDWLFETARNINIVKYVKILLEDYLNHLGGSSFQLRVEQGFADRCHWYRTNRISLEFNLLYRWHSIVPDKFWVAREDGKKRLLEHTDFRFNNEIVEKYGIEALIDSASKQPAGLIGLHNTPPFLLGAEMLSIDLARQFRLAPFNAYRKRWDLPPYKSFRELTGDVRLADELAEIYPDRDGVRGIDRMEFVVGLFAEACQPHHVLPTLLGVMVACDAFTHALTNPLLAASVYGEEALTDFGVKEVERVGSLADIMKQNCLQPEKPPLTSFALCQPEA